MIDSNYFFINVICLSIGTIFIRGFFIALSSKMKPSDNIRELFTYIPAAIFPALIIPSTFFHQGSVEWLQNKERFVVLMAATVACYFYRNTLFVVCFGLALLFIVKFHT